MKMTKQQIKEILQESVDQGLARSQRYLKSLGHLHNPNKWPELFRNDRFETVHEGLDPVCEKLLEMLGPNHPVVLDHGNGPEVDMCEDYELFDCLDGLFTGVQFGKLRVHKGNFDRLASWVRKELA